MTKKKICFIVWGLTAGGQERIASGLANFSSNKGYDTTLVLLSKGDHFFEIDKKIRIYEPDLYRKDKNKYMYALFITQYIRRVLKEINPSSVFVIGEWINSFVLASTLGLEYPIYISNRLSPLRKLSFIHDIANKVFYPRAKGIIAQTTFAADVIKEKTGAKNIKVIPNPVHLIPRDKNSIPSNIILSVGRLAEEKGHKYLIEAFSKINRQDWALSIVGDGPERKSLEILVDQLKIKHRVQFHGNQLNLSPYYSEAKIFVLPSLSEGYPNALIEAMSFPLACISFDCVAGPKDVIENGINGILVKEANIEELTASLNFLIDNEDAMNGLMRQSIFIREKLSFEKIANDYLNFIIRSQ